MTGEKMFRAPEEIRRLAGEWRRLPGWWQRPSGEAAWRYTMRSVGHVFLLVCGTMHEDWWEKVTAVCPDRVRVKLAGNAYVGECLRRNRRLRARWVRCDVSDCPHRGACPCWRMQFPTDGEIMCLFLSCFKETAK